MQIERKQKLEKALNNKHSGIIVLEDVHDPHNAAAVMRSAEAFGFATIALVFNKEKKWNPKKIGKVSSASANKWLNFEIYPSIEECYRSLRRRKYRILTTALVSKSKNLIKYKFNNPKSAIVFGNEHSGLSEEAVKLSDEVIQIPMQGLVQSLNISVTAAIFMYEYFKQNKSALSLSEKTKIRKKWLGAKNSKS